VHSNPGSIAYGDSGGLLSAVLKGKETEESNPRRLLVWDVNAQYTTFFFKAVVLLRVGHLTILPGSDVVEFNDWFCGTRRMGAT
jgi:hypothetical protein